MSDSPGIMIVRLRTEGMRCHSCEQVLSAWLRDIVGVQAVVADHEVGMVTIFASDDASIDAMLKAVVHAGFVPGDPEVAEAVLGAPSVEMPIAASKADPPIQPQLFVMAETGLSHLPFARGRSC